MEGTYDVWFGTEAVGKVKVEKQGLYYRFCCRCSYLQSNMYHLVASWPGGQERLGLLVPEDGYLVLDTRLPVKHLGRGALRFKLLPKHEKAAGQFVPVYPEEPFAYLRRLENAYLAERNGKPGVVLQDN